MSWAATTHAPARCESEVSRRISASETTTMDDETASQLSHHQHHHHHHDEARFSCNICLDPVTEPVVTQCGHLYCWPCLYRWLEPGLLPEEWQSLVGNGNGNHQMIMNRRRRMVDHSRRVCPVCKAACSVASVIPIYAVVEPSPAVAAAAATKSTRRGQRRVHSSQSHDRIHRNDDDDDDDDNNDHEDDNSLASHPHHEAAGEEDQSHEEGIEHHNVARASAAAAAYENESDPLPAEDITLPTTSDNRVSQLRQRNTRSRSSHQDTDDTGTVPARPVPARAESNDHHQQQQHHHHPQDEIAHGMSTSAMVPMTRSSAQSTLLGLAFYQMFQPPQSSTSNYENSAVPPLHRDSFHARRRRGGSPSPNHNDSLHHNNNHNGMSSSSNTSGISTMPPELRVDDPDATEYLSRILLLLGSFVILCLLLF